MKKLTYLVIATAALGMVACTGNKAGYVITGTVEGAADGDTVYLQEATGRNLTKLDTAVISKGTFTFEGTQDSAVNRYVTCEVNGEPLMIDFFLENGKINIALTKDNDSATGTSNNDAYQAIRTQINDISQKMNAIYEAMGDSSLSDEQKEAKQKEGARLEEEYDKVIKEGVQKNITNPATGSPIIRRLWTVGSGHSRQLMSSYTRTQSWRASLPETVRSQQELSGRWNCWNARMSACSAVRKASGPSRMQTAWEA